MSAVTITGESIVTIGVALAMSAILLMVKGPRAAIAPFLVLLVFPMLAFTRMVVFQPMPESGFGRARIGFQVTRPLDQMDFTLRETFARATQAMAGEATRPSTFPSGHAARVMFLGLLAAGLIAWSRPRWTQYAAYAAAAASILIVGISRLYFGYHWASDVAGGYLVGALLLVLATLLLAEASGSGGRLNRDGFPTSNLRGKV
jgi:membrane-associated phospholipid phosphatase